MTDGRQPIADSHAVERPPSPFILALPKAELHLHLEGSVDAPTLCELSRRHNTPIPPQNNNYGESPDSGRELTENDVRSLYQYRDFTGFMMAFKAVTERLRTHEDYELITYRLMQHLAAENVLHAEVYVSVGVVIWRGFDFDAIFEGLDRGRRRGERDFGISLLWIFDAVRHFGAEAAGRVVDKAIQFRERNVVGIGIGGDERRGPAEWFRDAFARARQHGLRLTAHAGETTGPETIAASLDILGAERIGHALSAAQDPALMRRLAAQHVPVEICLSSNLRTGCCASLAQHPLKTYIDAGLVVTLNTDDPTMFDTTLSREFQLAQDTFGLSDDQLRTLARNSFRASFLPDDKKREFLHRF
jgi:adenosine deaminase/aminodeoxyfutalosine deaminase